MITYLFYAAYKRKNYKSKTAQTNPVSKMFSDTQMDLEKNTCDLNSTTQPFFEVGNTVSRVLIN